MGVDTKVGLNCVRGVYKAVSSNPKAVKGLNAIKKSLKKDKIPFTEELVLDESIRLRFLKSKNDNGVGWKHRTEDGVQKTEDLLIVTAFWGEKELKEFGETHKESITE